MTKTVRRCCLPAVLTLGLCVAAAGAVAQTTETGFLDRALVLDGATFRYQLYVPRDFTRARAWPVILALHGGGEYGNDGLKQTDGGLAHAIRSHPERFPAVVVFPQSLADNTPGWHLAGGRAALEALDRAVTEFNGDRSRLYLTGLSAGGNGAWFLASRHPDTFAAMIVVSSWISARKGTTSAVEYPSLATPGSADPFVDVAKRVAALPVRIFHGDADRTVPVDESRRMFAALKSLGADVQYVEFPGVPHNAWDLAYDRADLLAWLFQQHRR